MQTKFLKKITKNIGFFESPKMLCIFDRFDQNSTTQGRERKPALSIQLCGIKYGPAGIRTLINWSLLKMSRSQPHFLAATKTGKNRRFLQYPGYATGPQHIYKK